MSTLSLIRGDDRTLTVTVVDDLGAAANLTGILGMWFTVKRHQTDTDLEAVIQKSLGSGVAVTDAAGGIATVTLTAANTASATGLHFWDVQVKTAAGLITTLATGSVTFDEDVTLATS